LASEFTHQPVLLEESLSWLAPGGESLLVDGTLGGGGHAAAILERTAPNGRVIALDVDAQALEAAERRLRPYGDRVQCIHASFRRLGDVLLELGVRAVDGVLLDLGVSSHQLDVPERGFRFAESSAARTPLDMRMDGSASTTAADLLRSASPDELASWFRDYGDLREARRLARAIVAARQQRTLATARDLLDVIRETGAGGGRRHNPATRVFQALRIAVNDELGALAEGLEDAIEALRPGGRLVVIAYHSAEDRIVKRRFRDAARGCSCAPGVPVCVTRRPVTPGPDEIERNPRARSARLRAAERVAEAA
jgi:16S rRNA (cytosine1402-N4)-methyltransferase